MSNHEIADVISERVFESIDADGVTQQIKLVLGRPYQTSESNSSLQWRCPFQIMGLGSEKIHEAPGIDSLDALLVSLRIAEDHITSYAKRSQKQITWLKADALGLSTPHLPEDSEHANAEIDDTDFKEAFDKFFRDLDSKSSD